MSIVIYAVALAFSFSGFLAGGFCRNSKLHDHGQQMFDAGVKWERDRVASIASGRTHKYHVVRGAR